MVKSLDLMIIGAQKAGTTSLKNYLGEHPDICTHSQIEFPFFFRDHEYKRGYQKAFEKYFHHYHNERRIIAKNVNVMYHYKAIKRLHEYRNDIKLIIILRNPIERAFSAWLFEKRRGREKTERFEEIFNSEPECCDYLRKGLYHIYLEDILSLFKKEQVMVILFENFKENPLTVCEKIFRWLDIDCNFKPSIDVIHNKAATSRFQFITKLIMSDNIIKKMFKKLVPEYMSYKIGSFLLRLNEIDLRPLPLDNQTRSRLARYYKEPNKRLSELLQDDLTLWNENK